jgi:ketosteroid isomerase-like protein
MTHRHVLSLVALGAIVCTTAACTARAPAGAQRDEAAAVESALRSWYDASERHDSAAYAALLLPEFFIYEDTTRYGRSALIQLVAESFPAGTDRATLRDFNTQVSGDVAWTSFRNEEIFTPAGAAPLPVRRYLETAVLRRVGGQWKLERYHATRVNRPVPTK